MKMKTIIKFFSVFLLALMVTACSSEKTPEQVAEKFITAIYKGDLDTVMDLIYFPKEDSKDIDMTTLMKSKMQEALKRGKAFADEHGGFDKVETAPAEYTNNEKTMAKVQAIASFKDNTKKDEKNISLIKVDGKWLINMKI
jgi:protoporphyrinogen oxidase